MTKRQLKYAHHRAAGLPQTAAARAAGYSRKSAKVTASRMERDPAIQRAIKKAARARAAIPLSPRAYVDAQSYLLAVVRGAAPPDPVRVGAARALLPYLEPRRRAPKKAALRPREMQVAEVQADERARLDAWNLKASAVRARLKKRSSA